jgi:prevent-host-death family protein
MRTVCIAKLKARLSEYLRGVRAGRSVTVLDRKTPVARIVPIETTGPRLTGRKAERGSPALGKIPIPSLVAVRGDVVEILLEERKNHR